MAGKKEEMGEKGDKGTYGGGTLGEGRGRRGGGQALGHQVSGFVRVFLWLKVETPEAPPGTQLW